MYCLKCGGSLDRYDANNSNYLCNCKKEESGNLGEIRNAVLADVGERLLPCPFCGGEVNLQGLIGYAWTILCGDKTCPWFSFDKGLTREIVIEAWNKRANVS